MQDNGLIQVPLDAPVENTVLDEKQVTAEELKQQVDPVEAAAIYVNQSHKHFRNMAYALTNRRKRSIARVLEAVLFEPLEQVELNKEEQQFLELCNTILYNKGVLLRDIFEKRAKKVKIEGEEQNG